jgi:hypothetical protein
MFTSRLLNVVTAIVLVAVLMLTMREAIATNSMMADIESASRSRYAFNPELKAADHYSAESDASAASNQLAVNPELSVASRISELNRGVRVSTSINPELSAADRFAASIDRKGESELLSVNPELSVAWRYAAERAQK